MDDQDYRDAVLLAMLEHPGHAQQIAEWASDPANLSTFVDDASGHHHGGDGKFSSGSGSGGGAQAPAVHDSPHDSPPSATKPAGKSKLGKLLASAGKIPAAVKSKATDWVKKKYAGFVTRYGKTGARLVMGGMIALLPIPLPGTSVLPIALAEGIKQLRGIAGFTEPGDSSLELSGLDLDAAVNEALAEFYADMGEPLPANLDTGDAHAEASAAFSESEGEGGPAASGATFPAGDSADDQ